MDGDPYQQFKYVIHFTLEANNDAHQQCVNIYNGMINHIPEQLASFHFQILSDTEKEQEKTLSLVLLGRYFHFLISNSVILSNDTLEAIKTSILNLFKNEDFSQNQLDIVSNNIIILIQYIQGNWPELPESLSNSMISENPKISASATNCLFECIDNYLIDTERYFNIFYGFVFNFLNQTNHLYLPQVASFLKLFYTLAKFHYFEPLDAFLPIINKLPNFLLLTKDYPAIIKDFYAFINFDSFVFQSTFQSFFEILINMISDTNYSSVGDTIILTLDKLISSFYIDLSPHANSIFLFYAENLNREELQDNLMYSISNLSKLYGNNEEFAKNIFEYLKNKYPDPASFIAFSSAFNGIKSFFLNSEILLNQILAIFASSFCTNIESSKLSALQSFKRFISCIPNDCSTEFIEKCFMILVNNIKADEIGNIDVLLLELKVLKKLIKKFAIGFHSLIPKIIEILNYSINLNESIILLKIIFDCYSYIATSIKENFIPYSNQLMIKISQYMDNPKNYESQFFLCIELLPSLVHSIEQDAFIKFLMNSFHFLFNEIYDACGKEFENNSLSEQERCIIISFLLYSINEETIINTPEIRERIAQVAFNVLLNGPQFEKINKNFDMMIYKNCIIMNDPMSGERILIGNDQISKIKNAFNIINIIVNKNTIEISENSKQIKESLPQILELPFISKVMSYTN